VRLAVPTAAVLLPIAFFLSVLSPEARQPTPLVYVAYLGAVLLVTGLLTLGVGLLRTRQPRLVRQPARSRCRIMDGADQCRKVPKSLRRFCSDKIDLRGVGVTRQDGTLHCQPDK
jgi:hypothetical protein